MKFTIRLIAVATLLFGSCFFLSFVVAPRVAEGIWKQLGITQQDGNDKIKTSFIDGYLHLEGVRNAKNIAMGNRAAATTELLSYTKQFLSSPAFKSAYDKLRKEARPSEPTDNTQTKEQIRQDKIADTKKLIANTEKVISTGNADMKKTMQPILEMHKQHLAAYEAPNSPEIESLHQAQIDLHNRDVANYQKYTKEWEKRYPEDNRIFVKTRILQYLSLAATVDFAATTHEKNGKQVFDKQDYQYKSNDWKMIYRAGREVYEVIKPFAEKWLQELQ